MAIPGSISTDPDQEHLLVTFYAGDSAYGLDTGCVQEVVLVGAVTRVHHAPAEVRGIINLRGKIITVIGLNEKVSGSLGSSHGSCRTQISPESRILITSWSDESVGLLVDRVGDVLSTGSKELEPCPVNLPAEQRRFIDGVYRDADRAVAVLNLEALLA